MTDRVLAKDLVKVGLCMKGARPVCAHHGIDFRRLIREGIPIAEVESIDDAHIQRAVASARQRIEVENGRR